MSFDLMIYESGNGGDAQIKGNDLATTSAFYNMIYLAWFGGNVGQLTSDNEAIENEFKFDWWGNSLLFSETPEIQFNSRLEHALNDNSLNSAGLQRIEDAAKKDIEFLSSFANITVEVELISNDRVAITARLTEPDNVEDKVFQFIWSAVEGELIEQTTT